MVRLASSARAPSSLHVAQQEVRTEHHLLHHIRYLIVLSWWNRRCFTSAPAAQATRKLIPDRQAVTGPSAHVLPAWLSLHELAHDEDHTCGSEEEPRVNRTAKGNAGDEPRRRQPIQEEVAHTEQPRASGGKWRQSLQEPVAVPEQRRAPTAERAACQRAKQRHQPGGHQPQAGKRLARLNEVAEERGIGRHQSLQDGGEEADQVTAAD